MAVHFEIYTPSGELQLSTETRPIGKSNTLVNYVNPNSGGLAGYINLNNVYSMRDPQTLNINQAAGHVDYFLNENNDNEISVFQLEDGVLAGFNLTELRMNLVTKEWNILKGRTMYVDISAYTPTPKANEHIQVFDNLGNMVWGSESLISSIQLIEHKIFDVTGHNTLTHSPYYIDVPGDLDMKKVFILPVIDANYRIYGNTSSGGVAAWYTMNCKRVGRRYYFLPDYYEYFNGGAFSVQLSEGSWAMHYALGGYNSFSVMVFYMPGAPV